MTQPLIQILAKIEATRQKAKERQPVELPAVPAASPKVVQLPLWPEPARAAGCVCKGFSPRRAKPEGKASDAASSGG